LKTAQQAATNIAGQLALAKEESAKFETNAQAAREEANLAKQQVANAQQAKVNAEQAVANAKAAFAKAQQNANAASGEEKRKLKMIAEKALRNLQAKEEQTKQLEVNLVRAATEKTQELERRVDAETQLSQLQTSGRSTRLNMPTYANVTRTGSRKPSWNPSTRIRGGKRKTYSRRSNRKNRTRKQ
jgi:hypothetical protein